MAIIDDVKRRRLVLEADRWQIGFLRISDVNGRLAMPILAQRKLRFQVTPMTRPVGLAVVPAVLRMTLLRSTACYEGKRADDYKQRMIPLSQGSHPPHSSTKQAMER